MPGTITAAVRARRPAAGIAERSASAGVHGWAVRGVRPSAIAVAMRGAERSACVLGEMAALVAHGMPASLAAESVTWPGSTGCWCRPSSRRRSNRRPTGHFDAARVDRHDAPVLVGLPAGARHELALFCFATCLRRLGAPVVYLGPDLPDRVSGAAAVVHRALVAGRV